MHIIFRIMPFIWHKYMHVFILTQLNILPDFCQFWKIMFKKSNLFGPTPKVVSRFLLAYKEQRAKNHMVGNHLKSDNLQYNTLGRSTHRPSVWWSKYYFDRLKIKQWVAGLDLEHSKIFIFIILKIVVFKVSLPYPFFMLSQ